MPLMVIESPIQISSLVQAANNRLCLIEQCGRMVDRVKEIKRQKRVGVEVLCELGNVVTKLHENGSGFIKEQGVQDAR